MIIKSIVHDRILILYFNTISSKALDYRILKSEVNEARKAKLYLDLLSDNINYALEKSVTLIDQR